MCGVWVSFVVSIHSVSCAFTICRASTRAFFTSSGEGTLSDCFKISSISGCVILVDVLKHRSNFYYHVYP